MRFAPDGARAAARSRCSSGPANRRLAALLRDEPGGLGPTHEPLDALATDADVVEHPQFGMDRRRAITVVLLSSAFIASSMLVSGSSATKAGPSSQARHAQKR